MNKHLFTVIGALAFALVASGCATGPQKVAVAKVPPIKPPPVSKVDPKVNAAKTLELIKTMETEDLYKKYLDLNTKELVDFDTMMKRLGNTRVIYLGEAHATPAHHKLQLDILDNLYKKNPQTVLAMEFLYRSKQEIIDEYTAGRMAEKEFFNKVASGFGSFFWAYQDILRYVGSNGLKTLGLNVERPIKKKMVDEGWDSLTDDEKKLIAKDIDLQQQDHRDYVLPQLRAVASSMGPMAGAARGGDMLEKLYYHHTIWDETMGEAIANYLKNADKRAQVVVIAGSTHTNYKLGIPSRAHKRYPAPFKSLAPFQFTDKNRANFEKLMDSNIGDFVFFSK